MALRTPGAWTGKMQLLTDEVVRKHQRQDASLYAGVCALHWKMARTTNREHLAEEYASLLSRALTEDPSLLALALSGPTLAEDSPLKGKLGTLRRKLRVIQDRGRQGLVALAQLIESGGDDATVATEFARMEQVHNIELGSLSSPRRVAGKSPAGFGQAPTGTGGMGGMGGGGGGQQQQQQQQQPQAYNVQRDATRQQAEFAEAARVARIEEAAVARARIEWEREQAAGAAAAGSHDAWLLGGGDRGGRSGTVMLPGRHATMQGNQPQQQHQPYAGAPVALPSTNYLGGSSGGYGGGGQVSQPAVMSYGAAPGAAGNQGGTVQGSLGGATQVTSSPDRSRHSSVDVQKLKRENEELRASLQAANTAAKATASNQVTQAAVSSSRPTNRRMSLTAQKSAAMAQQQEEAAMAQQREEAAAAQQREEAAMAQQREEAAAAAAAVAEAARPPPPSQPPMLMMPAPVELPSPAAPLSVPAVVFADQMGADVADDAGGEGDAEAEGSLTAEKARRKAKREAKLLEKQQAAEAEQVVEAIDPTFSHHLDPTSPTQPRKSVALPAPPPPPAPPADMMEDTTASFMLPGAPGPPPTAAVPAVPHMPPAMLAEIAQTAEVEDLGDFDYDPTHYGYKDEELLAATFDAVMDIGASSLGLVMAPMIQSNDRATVVKSFSKRLDGSKGAAEKCGTITRFDLLMTVNGKLIDGTVYEDCIKLLKEAIRHPVIGPLGNKQVTMGFFKRAEVMKNRRDACLAWFKEAQALPRGQTPARQMRWTEFQWVDRYIVRGHILDTPPEDRKSVMRRYMLLFHPDRFIGKYGKFFVDQDLEIIAERVQWVSQELSLSKADMEEDEERQEQKMEKQREDARVKEEKAGGPEGGGPSAIPARTRKRAATVREQMSGFLLKEAISASIGSKNWRKRYFVLDNRANLYYYANQQEARKGKWKGRLELTDESCAIVRDDIRPYCLEIMTKDTTLYAAADSEEQRHAWMSALRSTIEFCTEDRKAKVAAPVAGGPLANAQGPAKQSGKVIRREPSKKGAKRFSMLPGKKITSFMQTKKGGKAQKGKHAHILIPPKAMRSRRLVTLEGWGTKLGGVRKNFTKRYFALWNQAVLYYFENEAAMEAFFDGDLSVDSANGSIDLRSVLHVKVSQKYAKRSGLELTTPHRVWVICPEEKKQTKKEKSRSSQAGADHANFFEWLSKLSEVVDGHQGYVAAAAPPPMPPSAGGAGSGGGGPPAGPPPSFPQGPPAITALVLLPQDELRVISCITISGWVHMRRDGQGAVLGTLWRLYSVSCVCIRVCAVCVLVYGGIVGTMVWERGAGAVETGRGVVCTFCVDHSCGYRRRDNIQYTLVRG